MPVRLFPDVSDEGVAAYLHLFLLLVVGSQAQPCALVLGPISRSLTGLRQTRVDAWRCPESMAIALFLRLPGH
jgi:hypothetical protein